MAMTKDDLFTKLKETLVSDFDLDESKITLDANIGLGFNRRGGNDCKDEAIPERKD